MKEDIVIEYGGFSPSPETQVYFKDLFEQLREEAPIWSRIVATIQKESDNFYRGKVEITSSAGKFVENDEAGNERDLGTKLFGHTQRQLDYWKSARRL